MQKVFDGSTALEAYMILNLLEQEGIKGRVDGEFLQGGVGEIQAIGIVRVMVEDADYPKARDIINAWEAQQTTSSISKPSKSARIDAVNGFFTGVFITAVIFYWAYNTPITQDGIDYNNDNIIDHKWIYKDYRTSSVETDRNLDGKVDFKLFYDRKGLEDYAQADHNFDNKFETKVIYKNGNPILEETDTDLDGVANYRIKYIFGIVDEIEIIEAASRKVRKIQKYVNGKLKSADYDSNGDGNLDVHYEYDAFEQAK